MQPLKITILGDYIDCQIYRGRLYLWTFNGELKIFSWEGIVRSFIERESDELTLYLAFIDGSLLYKKDISLIFKDKDLKKTLYNKTKLLEQRKFLITSKESEKYLFGKQDIPGKLLPIDTEIYSNNLYFINDNGLFVSSAHRDNKQYPVSSRPNKLWDNKLLGIKASKGPQIALSGGDEGLFELNLLKDYYNSSYSKLLTEVERSIRRVSSKHSSFSNYNHLSIYNSSNVNSSFMALFGWRNHPEAEKKSPWERVYEKEISVSSIFKGTNGTRYLSWGCEDKIYKATENGFEIVKFNNYAKPENGEEFFTPIKKLELAPYKGKVIHGGTSYFGTIIECENALVVMGSNEENYTIDGKRGITGWRVYPRSLNYENHLHVILDDRIEIYSFNHDYFLDQEMKTVGIEYNPETKRRWKFQN